MNYDRTLPGRAAKTAPAGPSSAPAEPTGADEAATRTLTEVKRSLLTLTGTLESALALEAENLAVLREVLVRLEGLYRLELSRHRPPPAPNVGRYVVLSAVLGSVLTTLLLYAAVYLGR